MQSKSEHCIALAEIGIQVQVTFVLSPATTLCMPNGSVQAMQHLDYIVGVTVQVTTSCTIQKILMH